MDAEGRITEAIHDYELFLGEKNDLKNQMEDLDQRIKRKADEICELISDANMTSFAYNGYTYTPKTIHKYYLISEADAVARGIDDRFAPFENDPDLSTLVKKDIRWQSMQSTLTEYDENVEGGIPEEILAVLNVKDEFGISRRRANTANARKVRSALDKRKSE